MRPRLAARPGPRLVAGPCRRWHTRGVTLPTSRFADSTPAGVLGTAGRYPVDSPEVLPLTLAGRPLLTPGPLRIYTCGITPYDVTHLGHASTFVWADLIASLAHATGVEALTCRNVTDVDDVLTAAARGKGRHYDDFALTQEFLFERDMRALSAARPDLTPHARGFIRPVQRLASALLHRGCRLRTRRLRLLPRRRRARGRRPVRSLGAGGLARRSGTRTTCRVATPRSTSRCGGRLGRTTLRGRARGAGAGPAGTRSAPRWRWPASATRSTCWSAAPT